VLDDTEERSWIGRSEEVEVTGGDLAGRDVVFAHEAEHLTLDRPEPRADVARLVKPPGDVNQIEVRRLGRHRHAVHHEARPKHRHVEALAVERHEHRRRRDPLRDARKHRRLFTEPPNEELLDDEAGWASFRAGIEPRQPDEERHRTGAGPQAGRLGIEVERARRLARGKPRIEGEEREQVRVGAPRGRDGDPPDAMFAAVTYEARVERTEDSVLDAERQLRDVHPRRLALRLAACSREDRVHPRPQIFEHASPRAWCDRLCDRLGGSRGGVHDARLRSEERGLEHRHGLGLGDRRLGERFEARRETSEPGRKARARRHPFHDTSEQQN
jgi:hypothetical protein